jgi:hypothetical protein
MLSMNPIIDTRNVMLLVIFRKSVIKKRNKIKEIRELYKILISILNNSDSPLNTLIMVILSHKKLVT